ncbi:MAG: hypothetical protein ACFFGZ_11095 [Candidatus Thorarchaeota archaeon]
MASATSPRKIKPAFTRCPVALIKRYCHYYEFCQMNPAHWDRDQSYPDCAARFGCFTQEQWEQIRR